MKKITINKVKPGIWLLYIDGQNIFLDLEDMYTLCKEVVNRLCRIKEVS